MGRGAGILIFMKNLSHTPDDINPNDLMRKMDQIIQYGSIKDLQTYIEEGGNVDQTDWEGRTALQMMSAKGNEEAVKFLLSKGADVNKIFMYRGRIPKTALDAARETKRKSIEEILVASGAKSAIELQQPQP
jgi:ankyrin repeat protein